MRKQKRQFTCYTEEESISEFFYGKAGNYEDVDVGFFSYMLSDRKSSYDNPRKVKITIELMDAK